MPPFRVAFYYSQQNRYSINSLLSALEDIELVPIMLIEEFEDLVKFSKEAVSAKEKVILMISLNSIQALSLEDKIRALKSFCGKNLILIGGGPHATGLPFHLLDMGFDFVVRKEGEDVVGKLLTAIMKGCDFTEIRGLLFRRDNGDIVDTGNSELIDMDRYYSFPVRMWKVFSPIEISRGCPYGCYYCQTPQIFGRAMRHRSLQKIMEMIEIMAKSGRKDIRFITPNALAYGSNGLTLNYGKVEELLRAARSILGKNGRIFFGTFPSEIRPEFVDREVVSLIKNYADNDNVTIGAQSGSERLLEKMGRKHTLGDVLKAVMLFRGAGFKVNVDFIFGLPDENENDLKETFKFIDSLVTLGAKIHAHYFLPLPSTPYGLKEPKPIGANVIKKLEELTGKGLVFGAWKKQVEISNSLSHLIMRYSSDF